MDLETRVKLNIYETIALTANPPSVEQVAAATAISETEVEGSFQSLSRKRLLVLEPGTVRIRMAPPFSGVETQFRVAVGSKTYYANCAWDAFGIAAALHKDADVYASCGDCRTPMLLQVRGGSPIQQECVIHFAVPASHWWDDIIYT
jgi:hypothetical protein